MQREKRQELAEAYENEYQGFNEQGTLKIARPEKGVKVLDTTTSADYKVTHGVFEQDPTMCLHPAGRRCSL